LLDIILAFCYNFLMRDDDTRKESQKGQDSIRHKVVRAVLGGMGKVEAAKVFGVSRSSIWTWMKKYHDEGKAALVSQKRGRKKGGNLTAKQEASIRRSVLGKNPGQLQLPCFLWTRDTVALLIFRRFGKQLSRWTVGRYLKAWGLTVQKPAKRAMEQNPAQVRYWLQTKYPNIVQQAKQEKAEIFWGDEMGLRSEHQTGTTWAAKGQTPVVKRSGSRFGCNMLSAITNRGSMAFMVFSGKFTWKVFLVFLARLIRQHAERKVFLIVDRHPVHQSRKVTEWLEKHHKNLSVFFLPAYSPELNPDELLNNATKNNVSRSGVQNKEELQSVLRSYLRSTQRRPERVKNFFKGKHVAYAQAA